MLSALRWNRCPRRAGFRSQFNIKSLLCTNTGCQMGGWFNSEITSPERFKGLRYRMAGPGAEVLRATSKPSRVNCLQTLRTP